MKKLSYKRILSALLAFVLLLSCFPVTTLASDGFVITCEGEVVTSVSFDRYEKLEVTAENIPEGTHQWQIKVPGVDLWVNIQGQTDATLGLTYALVGSLLDGDSVCVRCAAILDGEEIDYTPALRATVTEKAAEPAQTVVNTPVAVPAATTPTEVATEAPVEAATEAPVEAATEAPVEVTTEAPVEAATEAPAEAATEAPVEAATEAPAEAATEAPVEVTTEAPAEVATEAPVEAATEAPVEAATEAPVEVTTEAPVEAATEELVEVATEAPAEIATEAPVEEEQSGLAAFFSMMLTSDETDATTETTEDAEAQSSELVQVKVEFIRKVTDTDGNTTEVEVFSPYTADIIAGSSFVVSVPVPSSVGYTPYYNETAIADGKLDLNLTSVTESVTFTVEYRPAMVNYSVRYYVQNIYNDMYTEYVTGGSQTFQGYTGQYPSETIDISIPGFTKLYNQPEVIAADGSTVFQLYYDRNYYLYNFLLDGGYGTEPVYARYGTTLVVPAPTRSGYTFAGWDKQESDGTYDGTADTLPSTVGIGNATYKAIWTTDWTTFSVMYWVQNPDDDGFSFAYAFEDIPVQTGTSISWDNVFATYYSADQSESVVVTGALPDTLVDMYGKKLDDYCTPDRTATEQYNGMTSVTVEGDGSAIFNVCFTRNQYTQKFYYARSYVDNGTTIYEIPTDISGFNNGAAAGTIHEATWTEVSAKPSATGFNEQYDEITYNNVDYTYYYITLTARYEQNIEGNWPVSNISLNTDEGYSVSGWCSQYGTGYSDSGYYQTDVISGYYCAMDSMIIIDSEYTSTSETNNVAQTLLAKWVKDAVPVEFWIYVDVLGENNTSVAQANSPEYQTYMSLQTDNNGHYAGIGRNQGTDNYIDASTYSYYSDWKDFTRRYFEKRYTFYFYDENNKGAFENGRFSLPGFEYHARDNTGYYTRTNENNETALVYVFHYRRMLKNLQLDNYGAVYATHNNIEYEMPLNSYLPETLTADDYPDGLDPEAYEFGGWYTGPKGTGLKVVFTDDGIEEKTSTEWKNPTMPAENLILFAYWKKHTYQVEIYSTYTDVVAGTDRIGTVAATHGSPMETNTVLKLREDAEKDKPTEDAVFVGWFFVNDDGEIEAFDPANMGITGQMQLFAQWRTERNAQYTIYYKLKDDGTELAEKDEGYAYIASTRTFSAKIIQGYFPTYSSTSIVVDEDSAENVVTFYYEQKGSVNYTVKCWDATNSQWLSFTMNGSTGTEYTGETGNAVMEISAPTIADYLPTTSYYRLILSSDASQNVVIFEYTVNTTGEARYVIRHMLQSLEDEKVYDNEYQVLDPKATIGDMITVSALDIEGFAYENTVYTAAPNTDVGDDDTETVGLQVKLPAGGFDITVQYDRITYDYVIRFVESGDANKLLKESIEGEAKYGATVKLEGDDLPSQIEVGEVTYYLEDDEDDKSIVIGTTDNVLTYCYKAQTSVAKYIAVMQGSNDTGGSCTPASEEASGSYSGSTATANEGFYFAGWFTDYDCKTPVTDSDGTSNGNKFIPAANIDGTFYALFKPITLTISQTGMAATDSAVYKILKSDGTVYATVMLTGVSSVTIQQIPAGTYTVREVTGWTWTYGNAKEQEKVTVSQATSVSFEYGDNGPCWLHGEDRK